MEVQIGCAAAGSRTSPDGVPMADPRVCVRQATSVSARPAWAEPLRTRVKLERLERSNPPEFRRNEAFADRPERFPVRCLAPWATMVVEIGRVAAGSDTSPVGVPVAAQRLWVREATQASARPAGAEPPGTRVKLERLERSNPPEFHRNEAYADRPERFPLVGAGLADELPHATMRSPPRHGPSRSATRSDGIVKSTRVPWNGYDHSTRWLRWSANICTKSRRADHCTCSSGSGRCA